MLQEVLLAGQPSRELKPGFCSAVVVVPVTLWTKVKSLAVLQKTTTSEVVTAALNAFDFGTAFASTSSDGPKDGQAER